MAWFWHLRDSNLQPSTPHNTGYVWVRVVSYPAEPDADLGLGQHRQVEPLRAGLDQKGPFAAPERAEEPPRPAAQKIHHDPVLTQITATPGRTDSLQRPPCTRTKLHFDTDSVRIQSGIISAGYGVGSDDLSPNSALFASAIENVYEKTLLLSHRSRTGSRLGVAGFCGSQCATGSLDSVFQREVLDPNLSHESSTVAIFSLLFILDLLGASKRFRAVTAFNSRGHDRYCRQGARCGP